MRLYRKSGSGLIFWEALEHEDGVLTRWGQVGGAVQEHLEEIYEGKQGRDEQEQIEFRIESLENKKLDRGYKATQEEAVNSKWITGANGHPKPMLAKRFDRVRIGIRPGEPFFIQRKYDGHRCIIHNDGKEKIAYSRNGKQIWTIDHILNGLEVPVGAYLDGELYHHGTALQTISSWVKRSQHQSRQLQFVCYDMIDERQYGERFLDIQALEMGVGAIVCPTIETNDPEQIHPLLDQYREDGFEGAIVRLNDVGYQTNKRAPQLLKVKKFLDDEFTVVSINPSKEGWAILHCRMKTGVEFDVSAPGDMLTRRVTFTDRQDFIGRMVRVEYAGLTNKGKPFHPVATDWRDKENE